MNYRFWTGRVVFRTSAYGPLAGLSARTSVAFEVDAIDEASAEGWSVLVRGFARGVTHDHDLTRLWAKGPQPWASGSRTLMIAIEPTEISGRAVHGSWPRPGCRGQPPESADCLQGGASRWCRHRGGEALDRRRRRRCRTARQVVTDGLMVPRP